MITGLFIYNHKGEVLISRLFREGVKRNVCEVFRIQVISNLSDVKSPVLTLGSTTFLHIRHGLLWLVVVTRSNVDASTILEFQYKFMELLSSLILENQSKKLTETDIKDNFSLIYEILDEVIEFGYVSNLDLNSLKPYLTSPITKSSSSIAQEFENNNGKMMKGVTGLSSSMGGSTASGLLARATTMRRKSAGKLATVASFPNAGSPLENSESGTPWRSTGIKYKKNQVQLSVVENVNLLVSSSGSTIRSYVEGTITMDSKLSGTPTCSFALGREDSSRYEDDDTLQSSQLTDCNFHQSVNLKDFDEDGLIRFIPPDGEFELMKYRVNTSNMPFTVYVDIDTIGNSKLEYHIQLISNYPKKTTADNVTVKIPIPQSTIRSKINADNGKAKILDDQAIIQWQFKKIEGKQNFKLTAEIETVQHSTATGGSHDLISWMKSKPPISMNFNMDMYSISGNVVKFLNIMEPNEGYHAVKWVKYNSKAKSYEIRM
ncbi:hypothetical protein CANARDRAFT_27195 [[Candida] arabinofermentans NRRL YB-2248]|uniref:MHD domain-containing protein n=1 Tax=[Candida] arabinofermentans NRRL YB-2248 TaxID=983967 RepID=A0A1E4T4W6_9ASCO|nr:hypothetical protein CANARDRAFT_27195 [[Candida] arabinofermentans NRRL YB-2248]